MNIPAPAAVGGKYWRLQAGQTLDWPGGWCLWTIEGVYDGARASLQASSEAWSDEYIEFDHAVEQGQPLIASPMWIPASTLRVVITDQSAATSLTNMVQLCT